MGAETDRPLPDASRVSCLDGGFPKLSHAAALAVIADLGFSAVDIGVFSGYKHHTPPTLVVADPNRAAEAVIERLQISALHVADVFAVLGTDYIDLAVNHPERSVRDESFRHFQCLVRFAELIGSPGITILPGIQFDGVEIDLCLTLAASELQRRAELAGEHGLALSVEPHFESIMETPALAQAVLASAPAVTLTLDGSHFIYQGFDVEDIEALIPFTRHVQLRQASKGYMQTAVHEGTIDIARLVRSIVAAGYEGYFGIEYCWSQRLEMKAVDVISETASMRRILLREFRRIADGNDAA